MKIKFNISGHMVTVKKRFFHMRQSLKRARAYWQRKIWNRMWKSWKREKRIK